MDSEATNRSLLGDLTLTQVIAGAAASAASFALAKQTGILGSVIGAAVGSVAATIAGQVFTSMLDRSVESIRATTVPYDRMVPVQTVKRKKRSHKPALAALAIAALVGIAAVGVYAVGVDFITAGKGIGTQAPIIEYVMVPAEPEPEASEEDEAAAEEAAETTAAALEEPEEQDTPAADAEQAADEQVDAAPKELAAADGGETPLPEEEQPADAADSAQEEIVETIEESPAVDEADAAVVAADPIESTAVEETPAEG